MPPHPHPGGRGSYHAGIPPEISGLTPIPFARQEVSREQGSSPLVVCAPALCTALGGEQTTQVGSRPAGHLCLGLCVGVSAGVVLAQRLVSGGYAQTVCPLQFLEPRHLELTVARWKRSCSLQGESMPNSSGAS